MTELRLIGGGRAGLSTYELYLETVPSNQTPLTMAEWLEQVGATGAARDEAEAAAATATGAAGTATTQAGIATGAAGTATTQAGIATGAAGTATTQAGIATAAAGAALTHRNDAQAAAAAAAVVAGDSVGVYATTAGGLGATVQGAQFRVVNGAEVIQYRHDAGPTAVELARYPSSEGLIAAVDVLTDDDVAEFHGAAALPDFAVINDANEILFSVPAIDGAGWDAEFHPGPPGIDYAMTDVARKVVFGWQADGTFAVGGGNSELAGAVSALEGDVTTLQTDLTNVTGQVQALGEAQQFGFGVYATIAAGLADTVDGDFFAVSDAGSDVFQTLYRNDDGEEVFVNRVPQPELAPVSEALVAPGRLYRDNGLATVRRTYNNFWAPSGNASNFTTFGTNIFTGHVSLHGLYDQMVEDHPDYVSMQAIGVDALGNQIREYTFRPRALRIGAGDFEGWTAADGAFPKIVVIGGSHGSERTAFLSVLQFFDDLCNHWHLDQRIADLRHGCEFVLIPTIVPSGCDAATRKNHNGVDINRNHNWRWAESGSADPTNSYYRGPSPESELETQIGAALPGRHPTATAFVDFHNHTSPTQSNFSTWTGVSRLSELGVALAQLHEMQVYMTRDFPAFDNGGLQWSLLTRNAGGSITGAIINNANRAGYLHETPRWWNGMSTIDLMRHNHRATVSLLHNIWRREANRRLLNL
jgi:hypothetical protein